MLTIWHLLVLFAGIAAFMRAQHADEVGREGECIGCFGVATLMFGVLAYDLLWRTWT